MFTLNEIIRAITGKEFQIKDRCFKEAVVDSRVAEADTLFIAVPGEVTDGHRFIPAAFEKGAAAALIQEDAPEGCFCLDLRNGGQNARAESFPADGKFCVRVDNTIEALQQTAAWHRRQLKDMEVIGITGTVGKTTTKEAIFDVLSQHFNTLKSLGNMNNEIGLPLTLLRTDADTEQAILEMGFYVPGEIDQLCQIALPSVGVLTNVGMVHASRAGSMEVIARGKRELVEALPADGTAILNYDDPYVRPMAESCRGSVLFYGESADADLFVSDVESKGLDGLSFCLNFKGEKHPVHTSLIGRHSVMTALRAAAVGLVKGLSWEEIAAGLAKSRNALRMKTIRLASGALLIDDTYNASPESSIAALNLLAEVPGRKVAVLGEMRELGQYEQKGHEMTGVRAAEVCDELIAVGPVTRYLADAALRAGMNKDKVHWFETVQEVNDYFEEYPLSGGDVMLVKGSRGMRMERITAVLEEKE